MKLYRYLTGVDDETFCHGVSNALNCGWVLHGSPTLAFNGKSKQIVCGQAIVKDIEGEDYSPDIDLSRK